MYKGPARGGATVLAILEQRPHAGPPAQRTSAFETGHQPLAVDGALAVRQPGGYREIERPSRELSLAGGEPTPSLEVEDPLYHRPQIMDAAVVARPDPVWGESPCAFITLKPDAGPAAAEDIIAWCRANLAHYKVPRTIVFGPLPKTSTGKIQKFELRERARSLGLPGLATKPSASP